MNGICSTSWPTALLMTVEICTRDAIILANVSLAGLGLPYNVSGTITSHYSRTEEICFN